MSEDFRVPIDDDVKRTLNKLGGRIGAALPNGWGFALLLFEHGEQGSLCYISDSNRQDVVKALQEFMKIVGS